MVSRLFLVYVVVELAVVVALASTIGLGWTLLLLLAAFAGGTGVGGFATQAPAHAVAIRADRAPVAVGHRQRAGRAGNAARRGSGPGHHRRGAAAAVAADPGRRPPGADRDGRSRHRPACPADHGHHRRRRPIRAGRPRPDYIDGEVIDVSEVDPPALPRWSARTALPRAARSRRLYGVTERPHHPVGQRPGAQPDPSRRHRDGGPRRRRGRGWVATTSAAASSPMPRSSISTAASSRRASSTATSTSPRPV